MRRRSDSEHVGARAALRTLADDYESARTRVHAAYGKMRTALQPSYGPVDTRAAATELAEALRDATTAAVEYLRRLQEEEPRQRRGRRRRKATRAVSADVAAWSAELLRLTQISVWLRRATLDQPGVHIPTTVEFGDHAATGRDAVPVVADSDRLTPSGSSGRLIGNVDLRAIVDGYATTVGDETPTQ